MKVYIHYEDCEDEERHTTLKIKVPKKWRSGPVEKLKNVRRRRRSKNESSTFTNILHAQQFFIDFYNKKFADNKLEASKVAMKKKDVRPFRTVT